MNRSRVVGMNSISIVRHRWQFLAYEKAWSVQDERPMWITTSLHLEIWFTVLHKLQYGVYFMQIVSVTVSLLGWSASAQMTRQWYWIAIAKTKQNESLLIKLNHSSLTLLESIMFLGVQPTAKQFLWSQICSQLKP